MEEVSRSPPHLVLLRPAHQIMIQSKSPESHTLCLPLSEAAFRSFLQRRPCRRIHSYLDHLPAFMPHARLRIIAHSTRDTRLEFTLCTNVFTTARLNFELLALFLLAVVEQPDVARPASGDAPNIHTRRRACICRGVQCSPCTVYLFNQAHSVLHACVCAGL